LDSAGRQRAYGADRSSYLAHAEENLGDRPFELIRIDPKVAACR
jgi:hypothetical protein